MSSIKGQGGCSSQGGGWSQTCRSGLWPVPLPLCLASEAGSKEGVTGGRGPRLQHGDSPALCSPDADPAGEGGVRAPFLHLPTQSPLLS